MADIEKVSVLDLADLSPPNTSRDYVIIARAAADGQAARVGTIPVGEFPEGPQGLQGLQGIQGEKGWSPVLAVVVDGSRRVHQVIDWTGGAGVKPTVGLYVGATGLTASIAAAIDIRGASGAGSGDLVSANNLSDVANATTARTNLGLGAVATLALVDNAHLSTMVAATIKGRAAGGTDGAPQDLTPAQATAILTNFTGDAGAGGAKGLVPGPALGDAAAGKFLSANGGWAIPGNNVVVPWNMQNGKLVVSNNGSALKGEVKTLAGADPSAGSPVYYLLPDGTVVLITGPLSLTIPSGAALATSANIAFRLNWKLVYNTGTATTLLAVVQARGTTGVKFRNDGVDTTVAISAGANTGGVLYANAAVTSMPSVYIAQTVFPIGLSAAGTWNVNGATVHFMPGMKAPNDIVQSHSFSGGSQITATTAAYVDITGLVGSITLTSPANTIDWYFKVDGQTVAAGDAGIFAIRTGGVVLEGSPVYDAGSTMMAPVTAIGSYFPNSTAQTDFVISAQAAVGTVKAPSNFSVGADIALAERVC